ADDPQATHLALALLAVAGRIRERVEERFACRFDEPRARALAALGRLQQTLVALVGGDAPLYTCHGWFWLLEVGQQAADLLRVLAADDGLARVASRPARRLDLE